MKTKEVNRRRFLQYLATGMAVGFSGLAYAKTRHIRAAAIQMTPRLGSVEANLEQAAQLIDKAIRHGAGWIMLPEMFTSAAAFHEDIITAIRPIESAPTRLLRDKATRHQVAIGASFLAQEGNKVNNNFLLFLPDGSRYRYDKDQPTPRQLIDELFF